ncbi:MAG: BPSS1780 family membrane protein [Burkholderiales bacterium]
MAIQEDPSAELAAASVTDVTSTAQAGYVESGRPRDAGRGWEWISEGYRYFRRSTGLWILLTVIFFAMIVAFQVIPIVGWIAMTLLVPVFVGGLMAGCQAIERGGELELAHLFMGFRRNTAQLMLVGLIGFGLTAAIMLPAMVLVGAGSFVAAMMGSGTATPAVGASTMLALLIVLALIIPVNMALWFAPALVMLQNQAAPRALAQSFKGCIRNFVPFLIYGVVLFVLGFVASIPFGLGWLVLGPVVFGSVYAAYRDIYFER